MGCAGRRVYGPAGYSLTGFMAQGGHAGALRSPQLGLGPLPAPWAEFGGEESSRVQGWVQGVAQGGVGEGRVSPSIRTRVLSPQVPCQNLLPTVI